MQQPDWFRYSLTIPWWIKSYARKQKKRNHVPVLLLSFERLLDLYQNGYIIQFWFLCVIVLSGFTLAGTHYPGPGQLSRDIL